MTMVIRLRTICEAELWAGFFGYNTNGDQPECGFEIIEDVEEESLEVDQQGNMRPCYAIECPKCGTTIEWPQEWEVIEKNEDALDSQDISIRIPDTNFVWHRNALDKFRGKPDSEIRRMLKRLWYSKSEQDTIISFLHEINNRRRKEL